MSCERPSQRSAPRPRSPSLQTDDANRSHALQGTLQRCDRAARLVEQLLTLSRLESGAAPTLVTVDVNAAAAVRASEAAEQLRPGRSGEALRRRKPLNPRTR